MPAMFVLFVVFLTLKLTAVIGWSWLWITAPLWGPLAVVVVVFLFGLFLAAVASLATSNAFKRKSTGNYYTRPLVA